MPGGCSPELLGAGVVTGSADAVAATGEVARAPPPSEADRADLIPPEPEVGTGELSDANAINLADAPNRNAPPPKHGASGSREDASDGA